MKIVKLDGKERELPENASSAWAAIARGDADPGQQRLALKVLLAITGPDDIAPTEAPTRLVDMMDGARWVGRTIGRLTGAGVPHHYGDQDKDG